MTATARPEVLFVPWGATSVDLAARTAIQLRRDRGLGGLVVADKKALLPDLLASWPHRTLRTRTPVPVRTVVAVVRPSYELLAGLRTTADCVVVVAEDPAAPLDGWAQFVGARDVRSGDVLDFDLDDAVVEGFARLFDTSHEGLVDQRSMRRARAAIEHLRALGLSDAQIIGYLVSGRRPAGVRGYHGRDPINARTIRRLRTLLP